MGIHRITSETFNIFYTSHITFCFQILKPWSYWISTTHSNYCIVC